jgi:hypothetical protein
MNRVFFPLDGETEGLEGAIEEVEEGGGEVLRSLGVLPEGEGVALVLVIIDDCEGAGSSSSLIVGGAF